MPVVQRPPVMPTWVLAMALIVVGLALAVAVSFSFLYTKPTPSWVSQPYWNSWIWSDKAEDAVTTLERDDVYVVNFDLALLDYSQVSELAARPIAIDLQIGKTLAGYRGKATISVKPVIGGRGLALVEPEARGFRPETVDVDRLRRVSEWSRTAGLPRISHDVAAAQIPVKVIATEPGCASVAIAVWNEARTRPLDHVVRYVRVGGDVNDPSCVGEQPRSQPVKGGLRSLLSTRGDEADAALHVFEMEPAGKPESHAIFVQRGGAILSWTLDTHLSEWVTAGSGLVFDLDKARSDGDYTEMAEHLTNRIFKSDDSTPDDERALEILTEISASGAPKTIFARLVDVRGNNLFLPLGLILLNDGRLLDKSIIATQPLPRESYEAGRCVDTWKMVLPSRIPPVTPSHLEPIRPGRMSEWPDFARYLTDPNTRGTEPEGLLLLAHHWDGRLWFDRAGPSIASSEIKRRFPPGSIAVLAACGVGDLSKNSSRALLERLNEKGVDAVILSPFAVKPAVGARFAVHFEEAVQTARANREALTLDALFRRAAGSTRGDPTLNKWKEGVHEFLLAGNGGLSLCR